MLVQDLTGGQGQEEEGQRLALPGLGEDQEEDEDLEHELDAVLQGDAVMGKYTKVCLFTSPPVLGKHQLWQVFERKCAAWASGRLLLTGMHPKTSPSNTLAP